MEKNYKKKKKVTYYNLLIVQDLWQAHYQILSIIFLKKFIELDANIRESVDVLNVDIATVFLNAQILKII